MAGIMSVTAVSGSASGRIVQSYGVEGRLRALRAEEASIQAKLAALAQDGSSTPEGQQEASLYEARLATVQAQIAQLEAQQTQGETTNAQAQTPSSENETASDAGATQVSSAVSAANAGAMQASNATFTAFRHIHVVA